jgi:hypothetical protein
LPFRRAWFGSFDSHAWKNDDVGGGAYFISRRLAGPFHRELNDSTHGFFLANPAKIFNGATSN